MIRRFSKAYSTYNKVTYLYSVESMNEEYIYHVNRINEVLDDHGSNWDWEYFKLPIVFGSDGDVYFLSDDLQASFIGYDYNLNYSVYYDNNRNDLFKLLKETCLDTFRLFSEVNRFVRDDVKIYGLSKNFDKEGNYLYCKIYLNNEKDKKGFLDLLYNLYKPKLIDIENHIVFTEDLLYISLCGVKPDNIKYYYKLDWPDLTNSI